MFNIVLVEPEIPQNTGNIARTCAATGSKLHIVKPMGFEIDDKKLKRAGLDYWHLLGIKYYENLNDFFEQNKKEQPLTSYSEKSVFLLYLLREMLFYITLYTISIHDI